MSIDKPIVVLKRFFFGKSLSKLCLRQLQSFLVALNEHVQNFEKFKISFVQVVVSCFVTVKARIQ